MGLIETGSNAHAPASALQMQIVLNWTEATRPAAMNRQSVRQLMMRDEFWTVSSRNVINVHPRRAGLDAIRGEAKPRHDATEDSPRTTNEGEAEMSGSPHWTISATGLSRKLRR